MKERLPVANTNLNPSDARSSAQDLFERLLKEHRRPERPAANFAEYERWLRTQIAEIERQFIVEELQRHDLDVPMVLIEGVPYRRVLRCTETYTSAAGPVLVERTLYANRAEETRAACPMELRAGIVEGHWTPLAAQQAVWMVAHMTPQESADLCKMIGQMQPSKSSLDRLPKQLSERWEEDREALEAQVRSTVEIVPEEAVTIAVSLDGVLIPMRDGERQDKRARAAAEGRPASGPAGFQEVGCGTISFYDADGQRLSTVQFGRMPEHKKAALKKTLASELSAAMLQRPELQIVKVADGANDNWTFLHGGLPEGVEVVDFYHAAEHLHSALGAAYGEGSVKCRAQYEKLRTVLLEDAEGVEKVIRALAHLKKQHPRSKTISVELKYFRKHRHRMRYFTWKSAHLPIGSGVTEAACKTLVAQRMKRSGMRWRHEGGQAVLTFRSMIHSDRFDQAWALIAATYSAEVTLCENVIALSDHRR